MTIPKYSPFSCNTKSPYPTKSATNNKQDIIKTKITETATVLSLGINIKTIFIVYLSNIKILTKIK